MEFYRLPEGSVQIAFSGGRTSAYMLHQILEANGDLPDRCRVVFSNTGREFDQTLDFVAECGSRWGVRIDWLEYRAGKPGFEVVSHNSASRDGAPFETLIERRKFLPNQATRFCTQELKVRVAAKFCRAQGWASWTTALGIRADEAHRAARQTKEKWTVWRPLVEAGVTKRAVAAFWSCQPFDLRLDNINGKTPDGNCDGCFLKSEAYLARLAVRHPERAQWWQRMEALVAGSTRSKAAGTWSKRYSREELHALARFQPDMLDFLEQNGGLCQADGGECYGNA